MSHYDVVINEFIPVIIVKESFCQKQKTIQFPFYNSISQNFLQTLLRNWHYFEHRNNKIAVWFAHDTEDASSSSSSLSSSSSSSSPTSSPLDSTLASDSLTLPTRLRLLSSKESENLGVNMDPNKEYFSDSCGFYSDMKMNVSPFSVCPQKQLNTGKSSLQISSHIYIYIHTFTYQKKKTGRAHLQELKNMPKPKREGTSTDPKLKRNKKRNRFAPKDYTKIGMLWESLETSEQNNEICCINCFPMSDHGSSQCRTFSTMQTEFLQILQQNPLSSPLETAWSSAKFPDFLWADFLQRIPSIENFFQPILSIRPNSHFAFRSVEK